MLKRRIAFFVRHVCDEYDGDVARDVAEKFGLIYAAGRLGIRCGLLPWDKPELLDALTKCYIGARDLLPDDGVAIRQGITALRAKLHELPRTSKKAAAATDFDRNRWLPRTPEEGKPVCHQARCIQCHFCQWDTTDSRYRVADLKAAHHPRDSKSVCRRTIAQAAGTVYLAGWQEAPFDLRFDGRASRGSG